MVSLMMILVVELSMHGSKKTGESRGTAMYQFRLVEVYKEALNPTESLIESEEVFNHRMKQEETKAGH